MVPYENKDHDSGVIYYEVGDDFIDVMFRDGAVYRYTPESMGPGHLERMVQLAQAGDGLNSHITKYVRKKYSEKIR